MENILQVQNLLEKEYSQNEARQMVFQHMGETYTYFDEGCTRFVYVNKSRTKVIKMDKRIRAGENHWNELENSIYENASPENKDLMVPTKIHNGLIEQDFVTPVKYGGRKLSIKQKVFAASCRNEVGWTKDGKLLCFDLDEFKKY